MEFLRADYSTVNYWLCKQIPVMEIWFANAESNICIEAFLMRAYSFQYDAKDV